jgi:hypothetical protein
MELLSLTPDVFPRWLVVGVTAKRAGGPLVVVAVTVVNVRVHFV